MIAFKSHKRTTEHLGSSLDSASFVEPGDDPRLDLNENLGICVLMILVLPLSAANPEWLFAVFHFALLTLLQLLAIWAKRRWAASRAAREQNDPANSCNREIILPARKAEDRYRRSYGSSFGGLVFGCGLSGCIP